ncbi:MAG: PP2C family serine/threonine-protein phosphatase, partial [Candidatus Binatia bacterium]
GSLANICHVGDSRVYHVRNGYIEQLTEDHSFVQQLFQEGKLSSEEMKVSPHRHILTQAVGIGPLLHPALATSAAYPGDLFLLCSDGLHGVVSEDEILQAVLSQATDLQQACDVLVRLANERGGPDNCTVVLLRCDDEMSGSEGQTLRGE